MEFSVLQVDTTTKLLWSELSKQYISLSDLEKKIFHLLTESEKSYYFLIKNNPRKIEWLTVRILLTHVLNTYQPIQYNEMRKPYLLSNHNISITHSKDIAAIIISTDNQVSIDAERVTDKAKNIIHKFLSDKEIDKFRDLQSDYLYTLLWSVKECVYKSYSEKNIFFNSQIIVQDIDFKNNKITAEININNFNKKYVINFFEIQNNIITWYSN